MTDSDPSFTPYTPGNLPDFDESKVDSYNLLDYFPIKNVRDELWGIDLVDQSGQQMPDSLIESLIYASVDRVEKILNVSILPKYLDEHYDYYSQDWWSYQYVDLNYRPILKVKTFTILFQDKTIYKIPVNDWLRVYVNSGQVQVFPNLLLRGSDSSMDFSNIQFASYPLLGVLPITNQNYAPQVIHVTYYAGMLPQEKKGRTYEWEVPPALERLVTKLTAIEVFMRYSKLILPPGISSMQTSIDDISQMVDTIQSAENGAGNADILMWLRDCQSLISELKGYYGTNVGII